MTLAVGAACAADGVAPEPPPADASTVRALLPGTAVPAAGYVGETLQPRPALIAVDAAGRPVAGARVAFTITAGGGSIATALVVTDANGTAAEERWILGAAPGPNVLTASVGSVTRAITVQGVPRPTPLWAWRRIGAPLGDVGASAVIVDPRDPHTLYAPSLQRGLYVSRDEGATWSLALAVAGLDHSTVQIDPADPGTLWAAATPEIHVSTDQGRTWSVRGRIAERGGRSLLVSARDGSVYVGVQTRDVPGIYRSTDGGRTFAHRPLGVAPGTDIIPWQIAEDASGTLYVGTEIADHPTPYHPQLFRSLDRGVTWVDATGSLPWHVLRIGIDARRDRVLAMTEGAGLYESTDRGVTWSRLGRPIASDLLVDARNPDRMYGGEFSLHGLPGGAYRTTDAGLHWELIGLPNVQVSGLALSPAGDRLYACVPFDGIWVADVPDAGRGITRP